jgi:putative transposase
MSKGICWSMDFMSDSLANGRRIRTFNLVDDYNRECLHIEIDLSLPTQRVIRAIEQAAMIHGFPQVLRMDNGPEFTSIAFHDWAEMHAIKLEYIQPGKPTQNAYVERFNRTYREDILDMYLFDSLDDVRLKTEIWIEMYNTERPHDSLNNMSPKEYALTI